MFRPTTLVSFAALAVFASACAARQAPPPEGPPPELVSQDLNLIQDITTFNLTFEGSVSSPEQATVQTAKWELVVDGEVVKTGEEPVNTTIAAGETAPFTVKVETKYVDSAEELQKLSEKGGFLLTALRGKLVVDAGGRTHELDFARAREVRTPRLPSVKMQSMDGARYSADEANVIYYLGVVNPNPFHLGIDGLDYKITIGGKQVTEGTRGRGDKITPSATDVYEVQLSIREDTYGEEVKELLKTGELPWVVEGQLRGDLYAVPYRLEGTLRLPPPQR